MRAALRTQHINNFVRCGNQTNDPVINSNRNAAQLRLGPNNDPVIENLIIQSLPDLELVLPARG